jgi:hypothetical protein
MSEPGLNRQELIRRVHDHIAGVTSERDPLLSDLWAYQTLQCPALHLHAQSYGLEPGVGIARDKIMPVHTSAFRWGDLVTFHAADGQCAAEFHSSGTTTTGQHSRHLLHTLELYEASVCSAFRMVLTEIDSQDFQIISLLPTRANWPHSSLVHMFDTIIQRYDEEHGVHACDQDGRPDLQVLKGAIQNAQARNTPVLLLGAAFSHVMLLDTEDSTNLILPEGSVVLETGGTKGRTRSVERDELLSMLTRGYGVPLERILCEYGMAELGSQAYGWANKGIFQFPHWVHVEVRDPDSDQVQPRGEAGILRVYDPVNVDSCSFVETSDLAVQVSETEFQLLGRAHQSDPRGCSLLVPGELPRRDTQTKSLARPRMGYGPLNDPSFPLAARGKALADTWALLGRSGKVRGRGLAQMIGDAMGLEQSGVSEALLRESERWTDQRISELISREISPFQTGRIRPEPVGQVLIIPASTVPFAGLESVTVALIAGAAVDVRPSRRNPAEISYFVRALERCAPKLKERVRIISSNDEKGLHDSIARANCIVVHGSDDTIEYFRTYARPDTRLVTYGPRWSLLVLDVADANDPEVMSAVAQDILLHDSLGCLSPRLVLVAGDQRDALLVSDVLGGSMGSTSLRFPPHDEVERRSIGAGQINAAAAVLGRRARGLHAVQRFGSAHLLILGEAGKQNCKIEVPLPVVRRGTILANVSPSMPPEQWFGDMTEALSTVAMGPSLRKSTLGDSVEQWAVRMGASRITHAGRMQRPPSGWPHDGRPLLLPYVQFVTPG